ncbi:MAG TPA: heme-binding domain-containing protein [bacterium]|jgi:hypothetical protein|nr:heme-binding domain-containing protein [bacterium]
MNKGKAILAAAIVVLAVWWVLRPRERPHRPLAPLPEQLSPAVLADVGRSYTRNVEPIFKDACFDCHSTQTVWPWYHSLPGVRQFLDGHVEDGRRALDMSKGFPFDPGSKVLKDLRRIAGNVQSGDMPLWSYKLMHPLARLSDVQRQVIVTWAQDSFDRLTSTARDAGRPAPAGGKHRRHDAG